MLFSLHLSSREVEGLRPFRLQKGGNPPFLYLLSLRCSNVLCSLFGNVPGSLPSVSGKGRSPSTSRSDRRRQHSNKQHHDSIGDRKVINSKQATIVAINMFRLLSRQAVKAVPRPRAGLRISNSTTSRHVHSMQLPYTGPPSYDTIARRFSSDVVDPQAYLTRKRQQEAKNRGEFVDIHDIGRDPNDYVLITDIKHETLETTTAEELGIPYLSKATESQAKKVVQVHG